tara:strand:+ start:459 stop:710 length:252 start_codon:yes stop_codon:yes gene_type:complete
MRLQELTQIDNEVTKGKNKLLSGIVEYLIKKGINKNDIDLSDCITIYTDEKYHYNDIVKQLNPLNEVTINSNGDKASYISTNE